MDVQDLKVLLVLELFYKLPEGPTHKELRDTEPPDRGAHLNPVYRKAVLQSEGGGDARAGPSALDDFNIQHLNGSVLRNGKYVLEYEDAVYILGSGPPPNRT